MGKLRLNMALTVCAVSVMVRRNQVRGPGRVKSIECIGAAVLGPGAQHTGASWKFSSLRKIQAKQSETGKNIKENGKIKAKMANRK